MMFNSLIEDFMYLLNLQTREDFLLKRKKWGQAICLYLRCNEAGRKKNTITFTQAGVHIFKIVIRISFLDNSGTKLPEI